MKRTPLQRLTRADVCYRDGEPRKPTGPDLLRNFNSHTANHVMTILQDEAEQ